MLKKNTESHELVFHEGQQWVYEKANLEQGAYSLSDPDRNRVAVIFPNDKTKSIGTPPANANLYTRDFKSEEWEGYGPCGLEYALTRGNEHIKQYRKEWEFEQIPIKPELKQKMLEIIKKDTTGTFTSMETLEEKRQIKPLVNFKKFIEQRKLIKQLPDKEKNKVRESKRVMKENIREWIDTQNPRKDLMGKKQEILKSRPKKRIEQGMFRGLGEKIKLHMLAKAEVKRDYADQIIQKKNNHKESVINLLQSEGLLANDEKAITMNEPEERELEL